MFYPTSLRPIQCPRIGPPWRLLGEAQDYHRRGLDLIGNDPDFSSAHGDHLRHMAITGKLSEAIELIGLTIHGVYGDDQDPLSYYRGARLVLKATDSAGQNGKRAQTDVEMLKVEKLRESIDGKAEKLAKAFDQQNGNARTSDLLNSDDQELATRPAV